MLCSCVPVKSVEMAKSYYSNDEDKPVKDEYYANENSNECELENLGNLNENWQSSVLR